MRPRVFREMTRHRQEGRDGRAGGWTGERGRGQEEEEASGGRGEERADSRFGML